jgi:hypothetical protein
MEYMPGTLSPDEMAKMQMFAEALRQPQGGGSSFNPSQGAGVQMPQSNMAGNLSSAMSLAKSIKPGVESLLGTGGGVPGGTANFVPYSW